MKGREQPSIYKGLAWDAIEPKLREILPKTKNDIEITTRVTSLGFPAVKAVVPHLLMWMRDYNWPVAKIIGPFLSANSDHILTELKIVLKSSDDIWIGWVLTEIVSNMKNENIHQLYAELVVLSKRDSVEGIDDIATDLLKRVEAFSP